MKNPSNSLHEKNPPAFSGMVSSAETAVFMEKPRFFLEQHWNIILPSWWIFWCFLCLGFQEKVGDTTFLDWKFI